MLIAKKKSLGKNKILKELYFNNKLSCADLCLQINNSFSITQKLIDELVQKNLVTENIQAVSAGERGALTYSYTKNAMYLVAITMDQFVTKIAIMNVQNNFVSPIKKIVLPLQNNSEALEVLIEKIAQMIELCGIPKEKFVGIGIGMPGFVDAKKGINYSFLQLPNNKSITKHIAEKIGIPVFIDNDSNLIGLAELRFGAAKDDRDAMVINIGWGVGLGLILNEQIYRGYEGFAGEFSNIPLFLNGKLCWCGKAGCLETETSFLFLIERARKGINEGRISVLSALPLDDIELACAAIIKAVNASDQFAIELFSKAGYNIGKRVAFLIQLLNQKKIIISGRGSTAGQVWRIPIQKALNEYCIHRLLQSTCIEISTMGIEVELIGAASLIMENYEHLRVLKLESSH